MGETVDERKKRLDREDYGHELAGVETGRMQRFGVGAARAIAAKEKERHERAFRDALERLLRDPEYRRLYETLGERLGAAEIEADTAIALIQEQLRQADEKIAVMESNAARDPDGRLVFRSADGRVVYADGSGVQDQIAEGIIWPENAPSAEDYFAAKKHQADLEASLEDWFVYRNDVLGGIRDRSDDPDDPFEDKGALQDALERIEKLRPELATTTVEQPTNEQLATTADLSALNTSITLNR